MKDWIECTLGEIISVSSGKGLTSKSMSGKGYPVYGGNGITGYHSEYLYEEEKLIIGRVGVKCGVTLITKKNSWITDNALVVNPKLSFLNLKFMAFKLQFEDLNKLSNSTAQPVISGAKIYSYSISIPPLPEQRAIVAKIEQLFSELDNGISNLKKAREQLKVYRQAVLKKAFEGELTKAWRAQQNDLPSAEELLEQIKAERGEVMRCTGAKLKEFPIIEGDVLNSLPSLPPNWLWLNLGNLFSNSPHNGVYKPNSQYGEGIDIIRIDDFYSGKLIRYSGFKKVKLSENEVEKYLIKDGQLLINRVNSIEYLGKCGLVEKLSSPAVFESNIMKLEVLPSSVNPKYISLYLTSLLGIQEIRKNAKHAVNQASINQTDVSLASIPVTTLKEQQQIVQEIESRLSVCDKIEETIKESLEKAEALRQSILKKAFEGKLLSEAELEVCRKESDWEPAEQLLERIRNEKKGSSKGEQKKEKVKEVYG